MEPNPILANDFRRQWADIAADAMAAISRVGESGWYVLGNEVREFESVLASFWGLDHAVGVGNGLDAIEIGLRILGCKAGDRVLTTPLSAFATTLAILKLGAIPVFVDTDERGLIDLERCRQLLLGERSAGNPIRFFVPVHLYGLSLNLAELGSLRDEFDLQLLEDCAQSIGARFGGVAAGTVGQIAATSFYPTKNLGAMGDGGALLTVQAWIADQARVLRFYGETGRYHHTEIGYNSRLDEVQAALLKDACLPRLRQWIETRRRIAAVYQAGIRHPEVQVPFAPADCDPVWHLFPLQVAPQQRGSLLAHLKEREIGTGIHYPAAIPDQPVMQQTCHELADDCLQARRLAASEVSLPIHPYLNAEEVERVIDAVNSWQAGASRSV